LSLGIFVSVAACNAEASKDASVPCTHERECTTGYGCFPARNGATSQCQAQPACSRKCASDTDCKGLRVSTEGAECFVCKDVAGCPAANQDDAGSPLFVCIDRCVQ
jgi:hypothetical protein